MEGNRCTRMRGVMLTNTACSSLRGTELLLILSAGKQSITDHRAGITKIGCVHKHNLRSFSKEAERVTRVHHVLPWLVVLTTVRLRESEPTSRVLPLHSLWPVPEVPCRSSSCNTEFGVHFREPLKWLYAETQCMKFCPWVAESPQFLSKPWSKEELLSSACPSWGTQEDTSRAELLLMLWK